MKTIIRILPSAIILGAALFVIATTACHSATPKPPAPIANTAQQQSDALTARVAQLEQQLGQAQQRVNETQQQLRQAFAIESALQKQRNDALDQAAVAQAQVQLLTQTQQQQASAPTQPAR